MMKKNTLIWDAPVRAVHWLLVICFVGAWLTSESERFALWHETFGLCMIGLALFRLSWGVVGTRHARFSAFLRGPQAIIQYLKALFSAKPEHTSGHNPAGGIAILLLLSLAMLTAATGYANSRELFGEGFSEVHELLAQGMMALVIVHVLAVILSSVLHKDNLVRAMFTGKKLAPAADAIKRTYVWLAVFVVLCAVTFAWFHLQMK